MSGDVFQKIDVLSKDALRLLKDPWLEEHNENSEPYRRFLYLLALRFRPRVIVELGMDIGHTTAHLCAAASQYGGVVYGLDNRPIKLPYVKEKYPGILKELWCDSLGGAQALEELGEKGNVGLVFQDSSHHGEHSRQEFRLWQPILASGAIWVCDDVSSSFKMTDEPFGMPDYWEWISLPKKLYGVGRPGNYLGVVLT